MTLKSLFKKQKVSVKASTPNKIGVKISYNKQVNFEDLSEFVTIDPKNIIEYYTRFISNLRDEALIAKNSNDIEYAYWLSLKIKNIQKTREQKIVNYYEKQLRMQEEI